MPQWLASLVRRATGGWALAFASVLLLAVLGRQVDLPTPLRTAAGALLLIVLLAGLARMAAGSSASGTSPAASELVADTNVGRKDAPALELADPAGYRVFTTKHDEIVTPGELIGAARLGKLRRALDRRLEEAGHCLDIAQPAPGLLAAIAPDAAIVLLLDNSGSLRWPPRDDRPVERDRQPLAAGGIGHDSKAMLVACLADRIACSLEGAGAAVEVLGFTTAHWQGGNSRRAWAAAGGPAAPGRLNDLRHIVYKDFARSCKSSAANLALMLDDSVLKENVDGEALAWAFGRLAQRPETDKMLVVLSDGDPVDDATRACNPSGYLERHLVQVIDAIEANGGIRLVGIGIGHDVSPYYRRAFDTGAAMVPTPELTLRLLAHIAGAIEEPGGDTSRVA